MRASRPVGSFLVAATVLVACSSDDDDSPGDGGAAGDSGAPMRDGGSPPGDASAPMDAQTDAGTWCEDCSLMTQLTRLAEPGSTDCGSIRGSWFDEEDAGTHAGDEDVLDCVRSALDATDPFVVVLELQGIDSTVRRAWVGSADGTVVALSFDSNICGGAECSTRCGPAIHRWACAEPTVAEPDEVIRCADPGEGEELCGPPG
jgi:hypothetical protein